MATEVRLPQWGIGMTEGTVVQWVKEVGDQVAEGDDLVEIDSAKAQDFVQSPVDGILVRICVEVDETVRASSAPRAFTNQSLHSAAGEGIDQIDDVSQ
jgi:pyruvate/2-oxoglutarate dehydrogenase complex dihydrolipoamide acyltransferase (E2) component